MPTRDPTYTRRESANPHRLACTNAIRTLATTKEPQPIVESQHTTALAATVFSGTTFTQHAMYARTWIRDHENNNTNGNASTAVGARSACSTGTPLRVA